jgi:hypothetical protein
VRLSRPAAAALAALVLLGGGLRAAQAASPNLARESADERFYAALARDLAQHGHYGDRSAGPRHPFHAAPGAPLAFAAAYRLTPAPRDAPTDIPAAYWLQALLGTLLIPAAFALARALSAPVWAALGAAAVVAVYPPLVRGAGELLSEPLGTLLLTLAMIALAGGAPWRRPAAGGAPRGGEPWRRAAAGGVLLGGAALTRPDLLPSAFVIALVLLLTRHRREAAVVLAATLLTAAPWVLYASLRQGEPVAIADSGAPTLFIGSYLPGDGTTEGLKAQLGDATRQRIPRLRGVSDHRLPGLAVINTVRLRRPDLSYDAALRAEARANLRRYALGHPGAYAAMMGRKAVRMWIRPSGPRTRTPQPWHLALLALSVLGLAAGLVAERARGLLLIAAVALTGTALHAVLVSHPRYALPLMPLLVAGGAAGLALAARRLPAAGALRPRGILRSA